MGPGVIVGKEIYIVYRESDYSKFPQLRPTTKDFPGADATPTVVMPGQSLLPITTATSASTSIPNFSNTSRSGSFTSDERAVIAIGCVLAALLLAAAVRFFLSLYQRKRQTNESDIDHSTTVIRDGATYSYPGWPAEPKTLGHTLTRTIFTGFFDAILVAAPLASIILGGYAKYFDNKFVDEYPGGRQVMIVTQYVRISRSFCAFFSY
jgi:hypothetical protein